MKYYTWAEETEARIMAEMQRNAALAQLESLVFEASHYLHGAGDNAQSLANEIKNAAHMVGANNSMLKDS